MTKYLYNDIFVNMVVFKPFFSIGKKSHPEFLYDISFGFIPRRFRANEGDRYIYQED